MELTSVATGIYIARVGTNNMPTSKESVGKTLATHPSNNNKGDNLIIILK